MPDISAFQESAFQLDAFQTEEPVEDPRLSGGGAGLWLPQTLPQPPGLGRAGRLPRSRDSLPTPQSPVLRRRLKPIEIPAQTLIEQQSTQQQREFEERFAAWGRGTRGEFICWEYLTKQKRLVEGRDFLFQSSKFGGRRVFGGLVIDFYIFTKNLVWQPQGEFFHVLQPGDRAKQRLEEARLVGQGYTVVYLYFRDLQTRPDYVLDLAWNGEGVSNPFIDMP